MEMMRPYRRKVVLRRFSPRRRLRKLYDVGYDRGRGQRRLGVRLWRASHKSGHLDRKRRDCGHGGPAPRPCFIQ